MVKKNKEGKGKGKGRGTHSSSVGESDPEMSVCGTCGCLTNADSIGCDYCATWVHDSEMCSGLPQQMIDAISECGGDSVKFVCMKCRLGKAPDRTSPQATDSGMRETMRQLFHQICGMSAAITGLTTQLAALIEKSSAPPTAPPTQQPTPTPPNPSLQSENPTVINRDTIREEVRELREREKRRNSIIIKGLQASSVGELVAKFEQMSETQLGGKVKLTDVVKIPNQTHMYRANIASDEQRKKVLDQAKNLKGSNFDPVFISKDLTRAQRTVLYERRKARRDALSTNGTTPSATPQSPPAIPDQVTQTAGAQEAGPVASQVN